MVCASAGETSTIQKPQSTAQMKTQTKFSPETAKFLQSMKKFNSQKESEFTFETSDSWCGTSFGFRLDFRRNYFNQHDAEIDRITQADIPLDDGSLCQMLLQFETIEGTSDRDYIKIGQRESQVEKTLYGTTINAGADDDIIDNRHENTHAPYTVQGVRAFGGEGLDHFRSTAPNSAMAALDMEIGESFTMHSSFELSDVHNKHDTQKITYASEHSFEEIDICDVVAIDIDLKNYMVIPENATVEETIVDGNKVVTVVSEI